MHLFKVVRGVLYELDTFQTSVGGRPAVFARISMKNLRPRFNRARVATGVRYDGSEFGPRSRTCCVRIYRFPRPRTPDRDGLYDQPGVGFNAASVYGLAPFPGGSMLSRDGQVLLLYPGASPGIGVSQSLAPDPPPVNTKTQFGRTIYDVALRARERKGLVFRMPVETLAPTDPALGQLASARFEQYLAITKRYWRSLLGGAMSVRVPERKVVDTFYSSIVQDALSRYQLPSGLWVQAVNKLRYHSFYLRDGSVISNMYDMVGLHRLAAENLEYFLTWQQSDGLFISRPEEYDGFGQALFALGDHYRRTRDAAFARRMLPAVQRAIDWFQRQRASDPTGLMPPNVNLQDNELVRGHLAGDNFWAAAGVAAAVDLAKGAGDGAAAAQWQGIYDDFVARLKQHVFTAQKGHGGAIPPSLDFRGGQDWGNLWASYPWPVLDPESRWSTARSRGPGGGSARASRPISIPGCCTTTSASASSRPTAAKRAAEGGRGPLRGAGPHDRHRRRLGGGHGSVRDRIVDDVTPRTAGSRPSTSPSAQHARARAGQRRVPDVGAVAGVAAPRKARLGRPGAHCPGSRVLLAARHQGPGGPNLEGHVQPHAPALARAYMARDVKATGLIAPRRDRAARALRAPRGSLAARRNGPDLPGHVRPPHQLYFNSPDGAVEAEAARRGHREPLPRAVEVARGAEQRPSRGGSGAFGRSIPPYCCSATAD